MEDKIPTFDEFVKSVIEYDFILNNEILPEDEYEETRKEIYEIYKTVVKLIQISRK